MDEEVRAYIFEMLRELAGMAEKAGDHALAAQIQKALPHRRQRKSPPDHSATISC